jgi:hypothetical protein
MNTIARICLIYAGTALLGLFTFVPNLTAADSRILELKHSVERQIERTKAARERADARIALSRIRSAAQTQRSQDDLLRQVELLQRVREVIQEQMAEAAQSNPPADPSVTREMAETMAELDAQIAQTQNLVAQMDTLIKTQEAESVDDGSGATPPGPETSVSPTPDPTLFPPLPRPK